VQSAGEVMQDAPRLPDDEALLLDEVLLDELVPATQLPWPSHFPPEHTVPAGSLSGYTHVPLVQMPMP
jgi:hypothetical protein